MALADNKTKIEALLAGINALPEAGSGEAPEPVLQEKSVTPTKEAQSVTPDAGYDGLEKVTVHPIPDAYIVPSGTVNIAQNGEHNVREAEKVNVAVPIPEFKTQEKTTTPTEEAQEITPDAGYDGLEKVTVHPIPDAYIVPSGTVDITQNGEHNVREAEKVNVAVPIPEFKTQEKTVTPTTSKQTVEPDADYDGLSKVTVNAVPTVAQATPNVSVSSAGLITASATQSAGYVAAGTKSATKQLTTQGAKTVTPTKSDQTVLNSGVYTTGAIRVAAIPSQYEDNTENLAGLNAANGGTAAGTMAGAVGNTEALADSHASIIAQIAAALEGKVAGGDGGGNSMITGTFSVTDLGMYEPGLNEYLLTPDEPIDVSSVRLIAVTEVYTNSDSQDVLLMFCRLSNDESFKRCRGRQGGTASISLGNPISISGNGAITAVGYFSGTNTIGFIAC